MAQVMEARPSARTRLINGDAEYSGQGGGSDVGKIQTRPRQTTLKAQGPQGLRLSRRSTDCSTPDSFSGQQPAAGVRPSRQLSPDQVGFQASMANVSSENWSIFAEESSKRLGEELASLEPKCASHQLEKYQVPQAMRCLECGDWVKTGQAAYKCASCEHVLCWSCKNSLDTEDDWLEMTLSEVDMQCGGSIDDVGAIPSTSSAQVASLSTGSKKMCMRCQTPYAGYGETCAGCRRTSARGGDIKECKACGSYSQCFGSTCEDCSSLPYQGHASSSGGKWNLLPAGSRPIH